MTLRCAIIRTKWSNIHWAPNTSGDSRLAAGRSRFRQSPVGSVVAAIERQLGHLRPALRSGQQDGAASSAMGDVRSAAHINPGWLRMARAIRVVWQGYRGKKATSSLKNVRRPALRRMKCASRTRARTIGSLRFDSTARGCLDRYDSYTERQLRRVLSPCGKRACRRRGIAVEQHLGFEARATVAVDGADRVWVAWEEGLPTGARTRAT